MYVESLMYDCFFLISCHDADNKGIEMQKWKKLHFFQETLLISIKLIEWLIEQFFLIYQMN